MRAVVFHNVGDIRYEPDWPEPLTLKPNEVKLAISWCGICGTDMEDYLHGAIIPVGKPHPFSGRMAPMVIGHEFSGRIAEVGSQVTKLKIGQRVAVECVRVCHECYWCQIGEYASCLNQVSVGQVDDGGMAEYCITAEENCIPLPEELSDDIAAVAEPLAVMVRAVRKGRVMIGDTVTVVGAGTIGLMGIAAARVAGASKIISITHGGKRAQVAAQMGTNYVLNTREPGWREEFLDITNGMGSEVVIDAGGNLAAMRLAVDLTMRRGRCVLNSVVNADVSLSAWDIVIDEKEVIGTVAHSFTHEFPWAVQFLADGRVNVESLITARIPLEQAVELGFNRLREDRSQIKILITPHESWV
jgi:(R,R)-butanediol dehydrogenase/meso-butanediol dehydrogenase/diacetyl reductase